MAERKTTKKETPVVLSPTFKGLAVAAMIVGIVGVVFCWIPFWGFVIAAVALVLGIIALVKRAPNHGMALAGTILGGVGILLNLIFVAAFIGLVVLSAGEHSYDATPIYDYNYDYNN